MLIVGPIYPAEFRSTGKVNCAVKRHKRTARVLAFTLSLAIAPVMAQTDHYLIHREFVDLVRVMNKGQP